MTRPMISSAICRSLMLRFCDAQDLEREPGAASLFTHDHAEGPVDHRPGCQRGAQLIGQHRLLGHPRGDAHRSGRVLREALSLPGLQLTEEPRIPGVKIQRSDWPALHLNRLR